ncbi:MAG: AAA-associated domain-containing protein [Candidatus Competibacteraceae bacterium]
MPSAHVAQLLGALDEISHPVYQGLVNLSALANALELKVDDLFPIVEALQLLDLAQTAGGDIRLTRHGEAFLAADIQHRKIIFGEHLLKRGVPLAGHICRGDRRTARPARAREPLLRELEDFLTEDEAKRVLQAIVD